MDYSPEATTAVSTFFILFSLLIGLAAYIFFAYCIKKIAEKAGIDDTSLWWVPFLNILLLLRVAGRPGWWILLFLIPLVNILIAFLVWIDVSNKLGHGTGWGIVAAVFGIIGVPYLAFADAPRA